MPPTIISPKVVTTQFTINQKQQPAEYAHGFHHKEYKLTNDYTRQVLFERICTTFAYRAITGDELKLELEKLMPDVSNNQRQKFFHRLVENMSLPTEQFEQFLEEEWETLTHHADKAHFPNR